MPNGDGGGFDFSGLFDPFLGVIGGIIGEIVAFLNALVNVLGAALNFLFDGELGIFGFARSIGEIAHSILKFIVDQIFKVWVVRGLHHLLDLYNKLREWARKLKAWLDKWRKLQQLTQGKALRDFINMIQRIRRVLVVFRILHLKFATKLDNWLAGIEGTVIRKFFQFGRKTNEIIGWLNVLFDPRGALMRFPLFLAAMKAPDTLLRLFTGRGLDFWYSKRAGAGVVLPAQQRGTQYYGTLQEDLKTGGGGVPAQRQSFATVLELYHSSR